LKDTGRKASL